MKEGELELKSAQKPNSPSSGKTGKTRLRNPAQDLDKQGEPTREIGERIESLGL